MSAPKPGRTLPWVAAVLALASGAAILAQRQRAPTAPPVDGAPASGTGRPVGRGAPTVPVSPLSESLGYEETDISTGLVIKSLAGWGATAAISIVILIFMINYWHRHDATAQAGLTSQQTATLQYPAPRLQDDPYRDLRDAEDAERAKLAGYAWTDPAHRTARIPIDRAMALVTGHSLEPTP